MKEMLKNDRMRCVKMKEHGPVSEWSGQPCSWCRGKHDAVDVEIDRISVSGTGQIEYVVSSVRVCPNDRGGEGRQSLWELIQGGITRIEVRRATKE